MSEEHVAATELPAASDAPAAPVSPEPPASIPAIEPAIAPESVDPTAAADPALAVEDGVLKATPAAAEPPVEEGKADVPAEPPLEAEPFEFAVPEGFQVDAERLGELQSVLREAGVTSKEHAEKLWGMHTQAMQELADNAAQQQIDAWTKQTQAWRREIFSDAELGGAGYKTNQAAAIRMLDLFTPAQHRDEMNRFLATTGATDHPALFRFLMNVAKKFDEPQSGPPPSPRPPAARTQMGTPPAADRTRFDYTHPRGSGRQS